MQRIEWAPEMSVGIDIIDEDHKRLIDLLNAYIDAVDADEGVFVFDSLFCEFFDYTGYHFAREEEMMAKAGYPDLEEHRRGHQTIIEQLEGMRRKVMLSVSAGMQDEVRAFLLDWLWVHIMIKDQAYAASLQDHFSKAA